MLACFKILFILTIGLLAISVSFANNNATRSKTAPKTLYCPAIKALKKNPKTRTWSASGGWKSYDISFVQKIDAFIGVQWVGANVGQIICIYHGKVKTSFPILLVFHTLTMPPSGGKWSKDLGGYFNCISKQQSDCSFVVMQKPPKQNLTKELEEIKRKPPSEHPTF